MNTTKNISIGGYAFIIEEDAYVKLSAYTGAIRANLAGTSGADEIMADIETRIAEILRENRKGREVVVLDDVNQMIARMGEPDVYVQDSGTEKEKQTNESDSGTTEKRIFRDPSHKVIAGVCGGLGAYFGVDPVWFRLAFVGLLFFYSASFWLYIILWIVIPMATTRLQKLQMRGKKPDLKNIEDSIRSEINGISNNKSIHEGVSKVTAALADVFAKLFHILGHLVKGIFKFLVGLLAICSLTFLIMLIIMLFTGVGNVKISGNEVNVDDFSGLIPYLFESRWEAGVFISFFFLFLAIPTVALLANSIRFLANIQTKISKWVSIVAVGVWLIATSGLAYSALHLGFGFSHSATGKTEELIPVPAGRSLVLRMGEKPEIQEGFSMSDISLDIREATDSAFSLRMYKEASGRTEIEADRRQRNILYKPLIQDTLLVFPELYLIPKGETLRAQSITMELRVPKNGKIFIEPGMQRLLNNVDNVQNMHDSEMPGQYWIMTELGLSCQGCTVPTPDSSTVY